MIQGVLKILLVQLLFAISEGAGESCANYVRYVRNTESNKLYCLIEIPSVPRGVNLQLHVDMSVAASLPPKYHLKLGLAQSSDHSLRAIWEGRPLRYRINIPSIPVTPTVYGLTFNNIQMCLGAKATGRIVTTITLDHTFTPPGVQPLSAGGGNVIPVDSDEDPEEETTTRRPRPWPKPVTQPTTVTQPGIVTRPPEIVTPPPATVTQLPTTVTRPQFGGGNIFLQPVQNTDDNCGRNSFTNRINLLVFRGTTTSPGQWPWLVAIFIIRSITEFEFQCAGNLVTNTHIITAAHCLRIGNQNAPAGVFHVSLGRYRLRDWRERGSENRNILEYIIHPDYDSNIRTADADLAIMVMRDRVEYSPMIKPICLWSGSPELGDVVGKYGFVVGWGQDELGNPYLQEPRMTKEPIVSQEDCLWSHPAFSGATSRRTFCAGSRIGRGPCNGDSGSGLVIQDQNTGRFQLRGIVSLSLRDNTSTSCDLTHYAVYVDVAKHLEWVQQQVGG